MVGELGPLEKRVGDQGREARSDADAPSAISRLSPQPPHTRNGPDQTASFQTSVKPVKPQFGLDGLVFVLFRPTERTRTSGGLLWPLVVGLVAESAS
jgi:hypothetical protein